MKMSNTGGKYFLLNTNIYKNPDASSLLGPNKHNQEIKADMEPEGWDVRNKNKQKSNH